MSLTDHTAQNQPLITIIVSVLNGSATLERCLESILFQTYPFKELIVMDGESTDGTLTILESFDDWIIYWESKPDRGIYHAWNKALGHAHGEWICFLGADDYFWNNQVLADLAPHLRRASESGIRVVYGQVAKLDEKGRILKLEGKPWEKVRWLMRHGMPLPHPGLMHHHTLFEIHGLFDDSYAIAGDYDLLLRELINGDALYAHGVRTVACQVGGMADSYGLLSHKEVARARRKNGLPFFSWIWFAVCARSMIRAQIRKFIRV